MHCEDCGTKLELNGICPWCHEELFIVTFQQSEFDCPVSEEFQEKVDEQAAIVRSRNAERRELAG